VGRGNAKKRQPGVKLIKTNRNTIRFMAGPPRQALNAPSLCCGWITVTLSKHFGHLWGMKRAIEQIVYWFNKSFNP